MLKYIALVSLCSGVVCAADFATGQAARAVIGQPTFTAQNTASQTTSTTLSGTVNTAGTAVTLVSGNNFPSALVNGSITINGTKYSVSGWTSGTSLTISTPAGNQTAVAYSSTITTTAYGCTGIPPAGVCFNKTLVGAMGGLAYLNGTLFVTDANRLGLQPSNNRVLLFNNINKSLPPAAADIAPYTGRCPVCVGTASVELDDVDNNGQPIQGTTAPTRTGVRQPVAVASDGSILAVADTSNNRVLIWNAIPSADHQGADIVLGQPDFTTLTQPLVVNSNSFRGPQGVWIQGNRFFVADTGNNRILIWNSIPARNNQPADLVLGQPNFNTAPPVDQLNLSLPATANTMLSPTSVTSDGQRLYVADLGFNRVLVWNNLPIATQQPADVVIGQHDFLSSTANDVTNLCDATLTSVVNVATTTSSSAITITVTWVSGQTFPSTIAGSQVVISGVTYRVSNWSSSTSITLAPLDLNPVNLTSVTATNYPTECGATLNFPRFALSDGKQRLFVADGGNDRVLIFDLTKLPVSSANGFRITAGSVLGQPDPFSNTYSNNSALVTSAADSTPTPTSLAWDAVNQNLYVADPTDYRILVFSPQTQNVQPGAVVNAASRAVYASGFVTVGGTIRVEDVATITINGTAPAASSTLATACTVPCYSYTVKTGDTTDLIAKGLAQAINNAKDPNVLAFEDTGTSVVRLIARKPGPDGNSVTLATTVGTNDQVSVGANGSSLTGGGSAAQVGPGTLLLINGQNLSDAGPNGVSVPLTAQLPFDLGGTQVYIDGMRVPLFMVSPTQIGAQVPWSIFGANSASLWVRTKHADNSVTITNPIGLPILTQNPGVFACNPAKPIDPANPFSCDPTGTEPRAAIALHTSNFASTVVSLNGGIQAGDNGRITIRDLPYIYNVQSEDTLVSVRDGLIAAINGDPNSSVVASPTAVGTQILLTAKAPGSAGSGITVVTSIGSTTLQGPQLTLTTTKPVTCCFAVGAALGGGAGTLVTQNNPAIPGEIIAVFAAGLGLVAPEAARITLNDGAPYTGPANNTARSDPSTTAGNGGAAVISAGLPNGSIGTYQILLELSAGINANSQAQLTISQGATTSNVVTIPIATPQAAYLVVTVDPTITIAKGTALNVTVTARDAFNNPVLNYSGTVHFSSGDTAATLPADGALGGGTGAFPITFNTSGSQTVSVIDTTTGITGTGTLVVP